MPAASFDSIFGAPKHGLPDSDSLKLDSRKKSTGKRASFLSFTRQALLFFANHVCVCGAPSRRGGALCFAGAGWAPCALFFSLYSPPKGCPLALLVYPGCMWQSCWEHRMHIVRTRVMTFFVRTLVVCASGSYWSKHNVLSIHFCFYFSC